MFHDGAYSSATKLIADVGRNRFGLDPATSEELVRWADMIDSAAFPNAKMAVERREPELKLLTVIEHLGDDALLTRMVGRLLEEPLSQVARSPEVEAAYAPSGHSRGVHRAGGPARRNDRGRGARRLDRPAHRGRGQVRHLRVAPSSVYSVVVNAPRASARSASAITHGRRRHAATTSRRSANAMEAEVIPSSAPSRWPRTGWKKLGRSRGRLPTSSRRDAVARGVAARRGHRGGRGRDGPPKTRSRRSSARRARALARSSWMRGRALGALLWSFTMRISRA